MHDFPVVVDRHRGPRLADTRVDHMHRRHRLALPVQSERRANPGHMSLRGFVAPHLAPHTRSLGSDNGRNAEPTAHNHDTIAGPNELVEAVDQCLLVVGNVAWFTGVTVRHEPLVQRSVLEGADAGPIVRTPDGHHAAQGVPPNEGHTSTGELSWPMPTPDCTYAGYEQLAPRVDCERPEMFACGGSLAR